MAINVLKLDYNIKGNERAWAGHLFDFRALEARGPRVCNPEISKLWAAITEQQDKTFTMKWKN